MFSSQIEGLWKRVGGAWNEDPVRGLLDVAEKDPSISRLLWAPEFGSDGDMDRFILQRAEEVKLGLFANHVYAVVPIYVTSMCAEHCVYCNYRAGNKSVDIERVRLSDGDLLREVEFLVLEKGLRGLELVYATDPKLRVDAMCRHVELLSEYLERHGGGVVGINAEAFDEHEYRALRDAGLNFAVLWQETYDRARYDTLHPGTTKKTHFEYRVDAYERMLAAGIQNIGMGVLSGLSDWRRDWAMLMEHESYLAREYNIGASILGVPRLKPAAGAVIQQTPFIPTRQEFLVTIALHNIFSPRTFPFVNTREDWELCVEMAKGGGCLFTFNCSTIPGGYSLGHHGYQFPTGTYDVPLFRPKLAEEGIETEFLWSFRNSVRFQTSTEQRELPCPAKS